VTSAGCTPEQYQRWHVRDCARCGRRAGLAANWPDGPLCRTCHQRAARTYGRCRDCGTRRLLPGRRPDGAPACRDCAGITRSFFCDRCGFEGFLLGGRPCERCTLTGKAAAALDDGTGHVSAPLAPLAEALAAMQTPRTGLKWIAAAHVRELLSDLAAGKVALTHQALAAQPHWRAVAHLRDLLMSCGVLPPADKQLLHFETWLHRHLAAAPAGPRTRLLHQYATWQQLPRLRARAAARPLTPAACSNAITQVTAAARFLAWLGERNLTTACLSQASIDTWHSTCRPGHKALSRQRHPAIRPAPRPHHPAHHRRHHPRRRRPDPPAARRPARTRPRAAGHHAAQPRRQPAEHEHRHQPRQPVAVPRPQGRPAAPPRNHGRTTHRVRHPHPRRAQPPCASSSSRHPPPSSPRPSATTTTPPTGTPAKPQDPGPATPPVTTQSDCHPGTPQGIRHPRTREHSTS
jgi:DNA-directed RNA polymerase subunit RPC12/RpoP